MISRRRVVALAGALTLVALPLHSSPAQSPVYAASAPAAPDSVLDVALVREIELARSRGVPTAPLLAKVREGRLKRAPSARIRVAVVALAARLDSARAALGTDAALDELVAGADALSAGASATSLRTVVAAATSRPITAPLGALAQLVASGIKPSRAAAMIVELLHRNATPAQALAFGNAVETDAAGGVPAEESAVFRLHGIGSTGISATQSGGSSSPASQMGSGALRPPAPGTSTTPKRRP